MLGIFFAAVAVTRMPLVGGGVGVLGLELFPGEGKGGVEGWRGLLARFSCVKKRGGSRTKWY